MAMTRREFLKVLARSIGIVSAASLGGAFYGYQIEPHHVEVVRKAFSLRGLPAAFEGYTITQISDLHLGFFINADQVVKLAEQVNALNADVIVMTGDFVAGHKVVVAEQIEPALKPFVARDGVYAILGNHDHWLNAQAVSQGIRAAGVSLLLNQHVRIQRGDESLYLAGVDDIWEKQHDLHAALRDIPEAACTILLAHEPDYADEVAADGRVALQLSGHSHGGQVRFPLRGAVALPHLGRKYDIGAYTIGDLQLYVNRGIGMTAVPLRFGCPPEITHITLHPV
jgi:uncharacterized protein